MRLPALILTALTALAAATGLGCARASAAPIEAPGPRPVILFVHGRGYAPGDSAIARASWLRALQSGARSAAGEPLLTDADVRNVWYADALDPRSQEGCSPVASRDGARVTEAGVMQGLGSFGRGLLGALLDMVPDTAAAPLHMLAGDIMYLADAGKRCAAERRVELALSRAAAEGRDVVVVAHSMGGLVAYRALGAPAHTGSSGAAVRRLVTLGTPLSVPFVREIALGSSGRLTKPERVGSWVNVRDPDDPFAPSILAESSGAAEVSLSPSGNAERAHDAMRYLGDVRTARVVLRAWCDGFRLERHAPAACRRLSAE